MKTFGKVGIVLVVLFGSSCQQSQVKQSDPVVERPTLTPGDTWSYLYNRDFFDVTFQRAQHGRLAFNTIYKKSPTGIRYQTPDLNYIKLVKANSPEDVIWELSPHSGHLEFPIFVGKSWRHNYISTGSTGTVSRSAYARVTAYEQITVPAGTFSAFRIERQDQKNDTRSRSGSVLGLAHETYWYAPKAKTIIKYYSTEFQINFELLRSSIAP